MNSLTNLIVPLNLTLLLAIPLLPLLAALVTGTLGTRFFGNVIGKSATHTITVACVAASFLLSAYILYLVAHGAHFDGVVYRWLTIGQSHWEIGFLIDSLSALMMCVVTFVSLMVHIYTIGYMHEDEGYNRFFSYISLFTFAMLMLVMSNNFLQLFFGWEAVGLVSYLLIGFWYTKPSAVFANLKAFLVNRVGDFGFILGIGLLWAAAGSLNYGDIFAAKQAIAQIHLPGTGWSLITVACLCLFIGAMGKSAQFPLHVWLPDSMEGPTPISALIHAATMVTAGIFMVARMSPLFELSETALSVVMVIGAITAFFMGLIGIVQNDIKRVIAYSTLSQLGYMTVALGASAYSVAIFHLMTHAFFKALLFLAAGSIILGMHHEQDIRKMGGLYKYFPVTWITSLLGSLALIGTPFFAGFYSKDSILEVVQHSHLAGARFAQFAVFAGVFVTAFYSFRMFFLVFHGKPRFVQDEAHKPHESPLVVTLPLILLAIPSVLIGFFTITPFLFGDFFRGAIEVLPAHDALLELAKEFHGPAVMALHAFTGAPFWLALAGVITAAIFYLVKPAIPAMLARELSAVHRMLDQKYWIDRLYESVIARGMRGVGRGLWKGGDQWLIDGLINGSARTVAALAGWVRTFQSGALYRYAFVMIFSVLGLLIYFVPLPF